MPSLFIHPVDATEELIPFTTMMTCLEEMRFLGSRLAARVDQHYYIGESFLQLISFMGCAPALQFHPESELDPFCHIILHGEQQTSLIFKHDLLHRLPRCPECRTSIKDWQDLLGQSPQPDPYRTVTCSGCDARLTLTQVDWRSQAGAFRLAIEITSIYPQEALPTEALLNRLQQSTGQHWKYFYAKPE